MAPWAAAPGRAGRGRWWCRGVITSYSIHYTKLYEDHRRRPRRRPRARHLHHRNNFV
ncbi:hypothetical protein [Streptomyces cyaneogriseus]|uniref:hypothetical protein n=1 Tax=Streptomyces cyaneogriseus TaxID=68192 RepID=UPI000A84FC46|nr:hypothetical protein [Streptomyces cyaneogriseus]